MQDRYKFKIWDKTEKKFLPLDSKTENTDSWISIDNTGVYLVERDNARDVAFFTDITEDVIILQCTGLIDINGKLIYEKDIIKCSHGSEFAIGVIEWDSEELQFALKIEDAFYSIRQKTKFDIIEILGNIYENPELLEINNEEIND